MVRLHPQVRMLQVRNARRTSCPMPSSERAQILTFRTRSIPNLWTRPMSSFWMYLFAACLCHTLQQMGSSAVQRIRHSALVIAASTRCWRWAQSIGRGCHVHTCVMAIGADFKMYLLRQFWSNQVEFFYNTQETQTQKNDGPEFWNLNYVIFDNFLVIFKKASRGPSAVDLDHYGRGQTRSQ